MRAVLGIAVMAALFGNAPLQCRSEPDPTLRKYETPEEALYDLALRFKRDRDVAAWRATLEYLVERYPNSRYAVRARDDLGRKDSAR